MATISGIRGMLLEEAMLYLLEWSGYRVVLHASPDDATLHHGHSGLEVRGRGGDHQIDAIADFRVAQPFTNPQRLLLEAKCYAPGRAIGIEIIRNAQGVLRDVSEYWVSRTGVPTRPRFHYQYAVFSTSHYTSGAERYAYAHDVYLIQLAENRYMQPIVDALMALTHHTFDAPDPNHIDVNLADIRQAARQTLRAWTTETADVASYEKELERIMLDTMKGGELSAFISACRALDGGLLATINHSFPVFLAPTPGISIRNLDNAYTVRILRDDLGWSITDSSSGEQLFTFDIPDELLNLYAAGGQLTPARKLDLKAEQFSMMQAYVTERRTDQRDSIRLVTFQLDREWLATLRERAARQ